MVVAFSVKNTAPTVSETLKDGTKIVSVNDEGNNCRTNLRVSAQKADEFVKERQSTIKNSEKKFWRTLGISSVIGAVAGGIVGSNSKFLIEEFGKKTGAGLAALFGTAFSLVLAPLFFNSAKDVSKLDQRFIKENS